MHKARYWNYWGGTACTSIALVDARDTQQVPELDVTQDPVGIIIGFNPPLPAQFPNIGSSPTTAQVNDGQASKFHVQAKVRINLGASRLGIPLPRWLVFLNLFEMIHKDPRQCRALLNSGYAFPFLNGRDVGTKLNEATRTLSISRTNILWICAAWSMNHCKDNQVLSYADSARSALAAWAALAPSVRTFGFASKGLQPANPRYALDCAHIGDSRNFFNSPPTWIP